MWQPLNSINTPTDGINNAISVISVDPWQGSATALPFPVAVGLIKSQANLKAGDAVLAVAVSAVTLENFSAALQSFSTAFEMPYFQRLNRRAIKQNELETTKFQLVPAQVSDKKLALNSLPALREAARKELVSASKALTDSFKIANPLSNLSDFSAAKTARAAALAAIPALPVSTDLARGTAWVFYAETDILSALEQNHPDKNYQFTTIMAFVAPAADLSALKGLFI